MDAGRTLFDGLPREVLDDLVSTLAHKRFPTGSVVVSEGDTTGVLYVVQSGSADVLVTDRAGVERSVGRIRRGATIGEMSALTGQPATATVRATRDLDVLVLDERDLDALSRRFPDLYRNLGAILADRLERTNRLAASRRPGRLVVLRDQGAPGLLPYALTASIAWHTRAPTLLVVLDEAAPELERLAVRGTTSSGNGQPDERAEVMLAGAARGFTSHSIPFSIEDLFQRYETILVHTEAQPPPFGTAYEVRVGGMHSSGAEGALVVRGWGTPPARVGPERGVLTVPEPSERELEELRAGRLSNSGPAGRAIGWAARDIAGLKVGLALGAGSFRGYAHAGVLHVLGRAGLTVDYIAGTSIGAAVASLHATGRTPAEIVELLDACAAAVFRPTIPIRSFSSSRPLAAVIRQLGQGRRIEDLPIPFAAVAADVDTHQEIVFRRGDLATAVMASVSIPGVYPAVRVGGRTLVDGGVLDPVPVSAVIEMGADQVVAVKLGGSPGEPVTDAAAIPGSGQTPIALSLILRSIEIMQARIETKTSAPTFFVTPSFEGIPPAGLRRFKANGRLYVRRGQQAAEAALPRLAVSFPWLRS
jgi:NTE family protein